MRTRRSRRFPIWRWPICGDCRPGRFRPWCLKFDASSLPVCLITLKGEGLNETQLRDLAQYNVRNQVANIPGAAVPQPFGGRYRQIMVYVDPLKLEAHELSVMDVVRSVNDANLILPAGHVAIGPYDYSLYTNSQVSSIPEIDQLPLKTVDGASVMVGDVGKARDASQIQTSVVRVDGQRSVYLPVLKQGGDVNTIAVVEGVKRAVSNLLDIPKSLVTSVIFDQSVFVKTSIENLLHEGAIGLVLTGLMILIFLGSMRATAAVFLSVPLSALATFIALSAGDNSVNAMVLGGLALAFFAVDRQFGGRVGEHLPPHGAWRTADGRRGKRRKGSGVAGAGGHAGDGDRILSGRVSVWGEQVSLHGAGAGRSPVPAGFLLRRHDRGAAFLCLLDQGSVGARSRRSSDPAPAWSASMPGSMRSSRPC